MQKISTLLITLLVTKLSVAQLYFPPITGNTWDTISPSSLGWCTDKLDSVIQFAGDKNTKALIVLKDGKRAVEKYYGTFKQDSIWFWASAGKSLTSLLVGIAQEQGFLNIQNPVSDYLGQGWTSCTPQQEANIKVVHQLSMTTGLDYSVLDDNCTIDTCLKYHADAGTEWYYYNAPYHLVHDVITAASGQGITAFTNSKLASKIGMQGLWYDHVYYSKARSAARFGLLMLNNAIWNTDTLLHDQQYLHDSRNTSQPYNKSYGYLWWLAGKDSIMAPGVSYVLPTTLCSNCPNDMYAALGKYDQKIYIVPSMNIVVVRFGNAAGTTALGPSSFDNELWGKFNEVFCATNQLSSNGSEININLYPNPCIDNLQINIPAELLGETIRIYNTIGELLWETQVKNTAFSVSTQTLSPGFYYLNIGQHSARFIKQ